MPGKIADAKGGASIESASAAEAAILVAVATCPALLIPFADHPFEPHKAAFLWVAAAAAFGAALSTPHASWRRIRALDGWPRALIFCAAITVVTTLVSTVLSEAPALAWWGSPLRRQGTLTGIAILYLMSTALVFSNEASFRRLVTATIVGSIGPTVYALYQVLGVDPLVWDVGVLSRASSTFGNPLFFGGYLVIVWPLTLGRAIVETRRLQIDHSLSVRVGGAWAMLALQSLALFATRSLGPVLALLVASAIAGIVALVVLGWRRTGAVLSGAALLGTLTLLLVAPPRMRASSTQASQDAEQRPSGSTVAVRVIMWDAVASGILAHADRLAFGSGPEATTALLGQHTGPALSALEGPNTAPDRSHNDTLETLASFGLAGLTMHLLIAGAALAAALSGLGLLGRSRLRAFAVVEVAALAIAVATATWSGGGLWALAVAPAAAVVLAVSAWIAWGAGDGAVPRPEIAIGIISATAAWIAHFIEIQMGVETSGSSLTAAVAMGVAVGLVRLGGGADSAADSRPARERERGTHEAAAWLAGWSAAVMTIGLAGPGNGGGALAWLIVATTWALALGVTGADLRGIVKSAAMWLTVTVVWLVWRDSPRAGSPQAVAMSLLEGLPLSYVAAAGCFVALSRSVSMGPMTKHSWPRITAPALVAGALAAVFSVRLTGADVLVRAGAQSLGVLDTASAIALFRDAADRDPTNDRALTQLGDALITQADATTDPGSRNAWLTQAAGALARARAADPFEYHHPRNLASLQRRWARRLPPGERGVHLEEADRYYREATELAPSAGALWAEWGNLDAERGRIVEAFAKLERAASLGSSVAAVSVADALLRATGGDVTRPDALARMGDDLKRRGYPALGLLYARKAAAADVAAR